MSDEASATPSTATATKPLVQVAFPAPSVAGRTATGPETVDGVALLTLDRPEARNAINFELLAELVEALEGLDRNPDCGAAVITGAGERAFAAGADIRELAEATPVSLIIENRFALWERLKAIHLPLVAAVRGFALGGGCELAMACDMIVAGEDARFGQPEVNLGVMPGAGGTQRLTRAIGKAKAMEMILTGRTIDAREADRLGLVTKVVPSEEAVARALELAAKIAAMPKLAIRAAKEAVAHADELSLTAGLEFERRNFFLLFASEDRSEGMAAFVEKRAPSWKGS